ncbi:ABC transporter permease [uncultured Methanobrevibacter sp.]|uniref:ABC transporter permease n=1 Tax=uncultured Methanobrevibacter sp. TaxID=253161 RepID=UPI00260F2B59|nr:ABC transporter permease [uncultured Methanobrevibacter sp.]
MLSKKMFRDIKNHKTQFLSIFLMAFLGVFVFAGIGGEYTGFEQSANDFYNSTNLADGWIYSAHLDNSTVDNVNNISATKSSERQLVVNAVADFNNDPDVTLHFVEKNDISKFYVLKGKNVDINDDNGVWLDKRFADAKNLSVGDNISFSVNGVTINKEIRGLGYSPENVYTSSDASIIPDFNKTGYAYLSYNAFPTQIKYNVLLVDFNGNPNDYVQDLDSAIGGNYSSFVKQADHQSVSQFNEEMDQHKMMGDIFPVVFILIAVLTLLTTMTRIINHQRTQIGVLKALGFKDRTIMLHYISYGFWLVLAGSIVGLILGPITIPRLFLNSMQSVYTLPEWKFGYSINFVIVAAIIVGVSLIASYWATRSISKENPANSIRPKSPKVSASGLLEKSKIWKKFSFNARWNYRDAKRNKTRALMTIVGVAGCTALLVSAFGMYDGMNDLRDWEYEDINHYSSKLIVGNGSITQINDISDKVDGVQLMEGAVEIQANGNKQSGSLLILDDNDLVTPTGTDRQPIDIPDNGVSISTKMAQLLNVEKGDTIKWHIVGSDKWISTKIDSIHADPISQGLIMSPDHFEDLGLKYVPTSIVTSQNVNDDYDGIKAINTMDTAISNWNEMTESMVSMVFLLIFFAAVLAIVVLYNLGLLSFTEIEREIATLKVIGFKTTNLRKLLLTQNLWFTSIGFIVGIPLGYYLMKLMMDSAGASFYYPIRLTPGNLILSFLITFSLSILVNLMFSGKIRKLNMVESLKGVE